MNAPRHVDSPVIVLCGSTRFVDVFNSTRQHLTREGYIVLSIEIVMTQSRAEDPQVMDRELKMKLDALHLDKIRLADEVMVLNVDGYLGPSTAREVVFAQSLGKPVTWLEPARVPGAEALIATAARWYQ